MKQVRKISSEVKKRFVRNVTKPNKKLFIFLISIAVFSGLLFLLISPVDLIENIGIHNVYIIVFFVSLFGGLSAGGSITFITLVISLAANGVNPFMLAMISGIALTLGDMFLFTTFSHGRRLVKKGWDKKIQSFSLRVLSHSLFSYVVPFGSYIYISFLPLPNDILLAFLATIDYNKNRLYVIIILGDLTFAFLLAFGTFYGFVNM